MEPITRHSHAPDIGFDGGDLDCGNGLLLLIRKHIDPLPRGGLLEILSREISVDEDLPAWCRLTGNELVSWTRTGGQRSFLVCKGRLAEREAAPAAPAPVVGGRRAGAARAPRPSAAAPDAAAGRHGRGQLAPAALDDRRHARARRGPAGGSRFPRDRRRRRAAGHRRAGEGRRGRGHRRRAAARQLRELCGLAPGQLPAHPADRPAAPGGRPRGIRAPSCARSISQPATCGTPPCSAACRAARPLVAHEVDFARSVSGKPGRDRRCPGPIRSTRTMWMECISDRAYDSREALAADVVRVLREELLELLDAGASLVQLDEPVLSEVVFSGAKNKRSFMCGALSESLAPEHELAFARDLLNAVFDGMPMDRTALHVCRGNWTPDESVALAGDYAPLLPTLAQVRVGAYLLEMCTPRAGDVSILEAPCRSTRASASAWSTRRTRPSKPTTRWPPASRAASTCSAASGCCCIRIAASRPSPTTRSAPRRSREEKLGAIARAAERFRA